MVECICASIAYRCSEVTEPLRVCVEMQCKARKTVTAGAPEARPRYNDVIYTSIREGQGVVGSTVNKTAMQEY